MITATTPEQHINNHILDDVVIDGQHVVHLQGIVNIFIADDKCTLYFVNEPQKVFFIHAIYNIF